MWCSHGSNSKQHEYPWGNEKWHSMGQPARTAECLQAAAWLLGSSCTEHIHNPCCLPHFHVTLGWQRCKMVWNAGFCACGAQYLCPFAFLYWWCRRVSVFYENFMLPLVHTASVITLPGKTMDREVLQYWISVPLYWFHIHLYCVIWIGSVCLFIRTANIYFFCDSWIMGFVRKTLQLMKIVLTGLHSVLAGKQLLQVAFATRNHSFSSALTLGKKENPG